MGKKRAVVAVTTEEVRTAFVQEYLASHEFGWGEDEIAAAEREGEAAFNVWLTNLVQESLRSASKMLSDVGEPQSADLVSKLAEDLG